MMVELSIDGVTLQLWRKPIKSLRLRVYSPEGHVRLSAPIWMSDRDIRDFVTQRLDWIKKQQARYLAKPRPPEVAMVSGERHQVFGEPHILQVATRGGRHEIQCEGRTLNLFVRSGTSTANRHRVLMEWYRAQLKQRIPEILKCWQPQIGVEVDDWRVKRMRTRWGSCNLFQKRIWLNLQLAQMPPACLEYVVVHELLHLLERYHNERFYGLLDHFLPSWRQSRQLLHDMIITPC